MTKYEVNVTCSFEVHLIVDDCAEGFEAEEQAEAIVVALIDKSGIPEDSYVSVDAWQSEEVEEKGGE